jgi:hypothetical protein
MDTITPFKWLYWLLSISVPKQADKELSGKPFL